MMKTFFFLLTFLSALCLPGIAGGQSSRIQQLETEMRAASGQERVEKLIALADACIQAGDYDKASNWADEAGNFAKRLRLPALRAAALNREGKALMLRGKRKADSRFEQSLDILRSINSGDKSLAMDNLENMRIIAQRAGKEKDVAYINEQIARLNNQLVTQLPQVQAPAPVTRQELDKEIGALQKEIARQQARMPGGKVNAAEMERQNQELQAQLAEREAQIDQMTEDQMKTSMLLMQQRYMLDSVVFRASLDSLSVANWNLALREAETNRKFYIAAIAALLILAGGSLYSFLRTRQHAKVLEGKNEVIKEEQRRSENLLLNILPSLVADELKKNGHTNARYFEDVSVLFADFVGFSKIAEQLKPQQLVSELDTAFKAFDAIIAKYQLEKIKTIGDAYMCAGGLPNGGGSQMRNMIDAAREMQHWLADWNKQRQEQGLPRFDARIGIHRGPVVAGVVGSKKFAFDIWGDTVNIAARVEQAGEGGKINISGEAYEVIKSYVDCQYRGKIAAKNKGEIDMYFVEN
ncbi:MAG: adenylate/guanylate cyclase domain-containing protein [Saprospiraceae bacterium]